MIRTRVIVHRDKSFAPRSVSEPRKRSKVYLTTSCFFRVDVQGPSFPSPHTRLYRDILDKNTNIKKINDVYFNFSNRSRMIGFK